MFKKLSNYFIYFAALVGVVSGVDGSFWLMNQSSSYAFYVGLFLLGAIAFLVISWILVLINKLKDKDGDVQ